MFVKKFEAASLEEALSAVKEAFGPDALILSTENRKSGLFQKGGVQVTAALSDPREAKAEEEAPARGIVYQRPAGAKARASAPRPSEPAGRPKYIEIDAHEEVAPPVRAAKHRGHRLEEMWLNLGYRRETAKEMASRMIVDFAREDLSDLGMVERIRAKLVSDSIRTLFLEAFDTRKRWLVVGSSGAGKTTVVAKLALALKRSGRGVALSSWEERKIIAARDLEGYARLLKVPFVKSDAKFSDRVILYDTSAWDLRHASTEKWLTESFDAVLFVADARERYSETLAVLNQVASKMPLTAVAFSRLDLIQSRGYLFDLLRSARVPLLGGSLSSSFKVPFKFFEVAELSQYVTKSIRGES